MPITVSLRHVSLDDEQHFNALSYTWGDETPTTQIAIHDGETLGFVSARRNLLEFLKEARQSTGEWSSEWIWIDQISINQDDQNERGHQVSQMGKLYSIAQMTLVWPWSWPESSVEPEQTTPATSQLDMNKLLCDDAHLTAVWKRSKKPEFPLLLLRHLTFGLYVRLREAPYWKRLWIIQEIVLARQCFIMISGKLWDLKHFIRLATWLIYLRRRDEDEEGVTFLWNLMNIVDLRTSRRKSLDRKILRVLGSSIPYGWDKVKNMILCLLTGYTVSWGFFTRIYISNPTTRSQNENCFAKFCTCKSQNSRVSDLTDGAEFTGYCRNGRILASNCPKTVSGIWTSN